jgi:hypothetical protein
MSLRHHYRRFLNDLSVPLWFALLINAVFMILSFLVGAFLAPCLDWIGF